MRKANPSEGRRVFYFQESIGWIVNPARTAALEICTRTVFETSSALLRFMKCRAEHIRFSISANPNRSFNPANCS